MVAFTLGVVIFGHQTDLLSSWAWLGVGFVFSMTLYFSYTYMAFFGGLILAIYTASLWPILLKRLVSFPAHKVLPMAMFVMIFYIMLSAWVVAYNFVPGGVLTRERTDVLLILLVLSCGLGTCSFPFQQAEVQVAEDSLKENQIKKGDKINIFGRVFRRLSTVTEFPEQEEEESNLNPDQVRQILSQSPFYSSRLPPCVIL